MEITKLSQEKITRAWWLLKLTYGLVYIVAGADKFLNIVTYWPKYVSPFLLTVLPISPEQLSMGVGIGEIILGLLILSVATRLGAYISMIWLIVIALNLLSFGLGVYVDIAVRDIAMAVGALVLAILTDVHDDVNR